LLDIGYSHRGAVVLMYLWTCILAFGGLAFVVYPWQIVLVVDLAAAAFLAVVTAWPYLRQRTPGQMAGPQE
jgi:UDP-GlcNAc:undecaprenyl-phosphate GlcNAc-1-phosphate transferase